MTRRTETSRIHAIAGDTVAQRKQHVAHLLSTLGFQMHQKQVRQEKGVLYALLPKPSSEQFLKLEALARKATVIFVPRDDREEVAHIEAIFEREPGWYFAVPVTRTYHPIVSPDELNTLLRWYHQMVGNQQALLEVIRHSEAEEDMVKPDEVEEN